jgi:8-oxo-dGTP diphosphatase
MQIREYPDRPLVGVGAVIVAQGRVVVVRRNRQPLRGEWSIPGGLLELGEAVRAGVAREAREETGLEVEVGEVLGVFDSIVTDPDRRTRYHYVLIDFLCRPVSGELRPGSDVSEAHWITAQDVNGLELTDSVAEVLRKALEMSTPRGQTHAGRR